MAKSAGQLYGMLKDDGADYLWLEALSSTQKLKEYVAVRGESRDEEFDGLLMDAADAINALVSHFCPDHLAKGLAKVISNYTVMKHLV